MRKPVVRSRVLILDGDGRQCLPFLRAFRRRGHHVAVACSSRFSMGYLSRYPNRRLLWPECAKAPDAFAERMLDYVRRHRPDATIAVDDFGADVLSRHKGDLLAYTGVPAPDYDVFLRGADKGRTMAFCMANGLPCPQTHFPDQEDLESIIAKVPFPVMVKPRRGIGAVGLHRLETPDLLRRHYQTIRRRYGELIVQEFIPLAGGTQYQAEAFVGADGKMKVCLVISKPRFFPVTGGTSTANVTIDRPDIQATVRRLLEGIGWVGAADVDFILDPRDNVPKILEFNPRVTAGIKIGFAAGVDYADLHLRLATGRDVPEIHSYKLGVCTRNLCLDILWYLCSDRQAVRSTRPPFFRFFGRDVYYQTFGADDPLPLFGFIVQKLRKFSTLQAWRAKLGKDLDQ